VVSTIWRYTGLSTEEMEGRIVSNYERAMSATVNDIARIESQTYNGIGVIKVFFHPSANLPASLAQIIAIAQTVIGGYPQGTVPPLILTYNASTVPILQLSLSSKSLGEHEIFDLANSFMRTQLATVQGAVMPYPYGGKFRSVMVDIDSRKLQAKSLSPLDVVNAVNAQNLVLPTGTAKIGEAEYNIAMNGSPKTIAELNDLPIKTGAAGTIYIRDVAQVHDGFQPQTNIVRHDGQRAVLVNILKYGTASTLDIVDRVKAELPKMAAGLPPDLTIKIATDQSIFVRAAVDGVIHEAILAGCLTALMILLFLGSWRSTLIIAVTIPLAILTSIIALFALGETINIMTLGGLALAVGILVDDATVAIENISQHLEQDKALDQAILDGAQQIAIPTFVSTLAICIVFVPMFLLTGVARYLFVPLAEAVVFAMLASYVFSRTLVPTLAKYLLRAGVLEHGHPKPSRNPFTRFHRAFERGFSGIRDNYHGFLERCMRHQKFFMLVFLAACIASGGLLPFVGRDFFPTVDAGQFKLHVRAKTGTRIEEMARLCDLVESEIRETIPASEIATIIDNIGLPLSGTNMSYNMSGTLGPADADVQVSLNAGHGPTERYMKELRKRLPEKFPGLTFYFLPADIVSQILNFGLPAPIDVQVVGRNIEGQPRLYDGLVSKAEAGGWPRRSAGAATVRPAQTGHQRGSDARATGRFLAERCRLEPADRTLGQLPDQPVLLAESEERRELQHHHADTAVQRRFPGSAGEHPDFGSELDADQYPRGSCDRGSRRRACREQPLERAARPRYFRGNAGPRPGRRGGRREQDRRRQHQRPAQGFAPDRARPDRNHAVFVPGVAVRPDLRRRHGLSADGGQLPVLAGSRSSSLLPYRQRWPASSGCCLPPEPRLACRR
jgi:multidrug efflux pump subunit AcrB